MEKNKMKKTVWGASVAVALTTSTALGVSAYQSGIDFQPSETEESFRANQVRFEDNEDAKGRDNTTEQNKSEFLEKDNNAENENRPQNQNDADYLFEREQLQQNFSDSIALNDNTADASAIGSAANGANTVYDVTDDRSQADVIINGNTGDADNSGGQGGTDTPSEPTQPTDPTQPTEPQPSKPSEGDNGGGTTSDTTPADPEPTPGYGDASIDPDVEKEPPAGWGESYTFVEGTVSDEDVFNITIQQRVGTGSSLYKGQKNITALTLFNALDTYVEDWYWNYHLWKEIHLNKFIRIDAVWIDGERISLLEDPNKTVDIPENLDEIQIEVSYRLSLKKDWTTVFVDYKLADTRLLILKQPLANEGQKIDNDMLANQWKDTNPKIDERVNLYYFQSSLLGNKKLDTLFRGWKENGEFVPWIYTVVAGRHVLEPSARIPLSSEYDVYVKSRWVEEDVYYGDVVAREQKLTYYQTLTGYRGNSDKLIVPKYVQAVDIVKDTAVQAVDAIEIPDTVQYINADMNYMTVNKEYIVDENNLFYHTTADGILTNKNGTEYLGIPYDRIKLTVPDGITKVVLPKNTQLQQVVIEAEDANHLPNIEFGGMNSGVIIVSDAAMAQFVSQNGMALSGKDIEVRSLSQIVKGDAVLSKDETILKNVFASNSLYTVPNTVTKIAENAFATAENVTRIILPNHEVTLEENCFANSNVGIVLCETQAQADAINAQLFAQGIADDVKALVLQFSKKGSTYFVDGNETVLLLAEKNITEFNGLETAQSGAAVVITEIADSAFENNKALQWVTLPEAVTKIGSRAFYNCTALEGVLIKTKDTITIGNLAFDGCPNLYFIASNAKNGDLGDYYIDLTYMGRNSQIVTQLVATDQTESGYSEQWYHIDGFSTLEVIDIGSTKMLYGLNEENQPILAIRSGKTTEGEIKLPAETVELFTQAMFETEGAFTLNWEELPNLQYIDSYALAYTGLKGSITANVTKFGDYSFYGTNITDITCQKQVDDVDELTFGGCSNLESVVFKEAFSWKSSFYTNVFSKCAKLKHVEINGFNPPRLTLYDPDTPFEFNEDWTEEEEAEYIVFPEELAESEIARTDFIKAWRYPMLGCEGVGNNTSYMRLWDNAIKYEVSPDIPYGEERFAAADALVKEKLLTIENRIRRMLGAKEADEPTEFYPYRNIGNYLTLIGAPSNIVGVCLNADTIGLPEGWCLDYVGTGAFSNCKNLKSVMFDNGFAGIEYDAFAGVESDKLVLSFMDVHPPELLLNKYGEAGTPFTFGVDINKLQINIFTGGDNSIFIDYIEKWAYPLAGYEDYADMYAAYAEKMGADATKEKIHAAMTEALLPIENQLRSIILYYDSDFLLVTLPSVNELSFTLGLPEQAEEDEPAVFEEEPQDTPDDSSKDDIQNGTDDANKENDKNQAGDSTGGSSGDNTDEAEPTDPAQEPVTLPDLSEERPVIVEIEIPTVPEETEDAPKEEQNEMPKNGEEESTSPREGEEGGTE